MEVKPRTVLRLVLALAPLAGCVQLPHPVALSDQQQTLARRVGDYLDGLRRFRADYSQTGFLGPGAGTVWVDRPGRLRVTAAGRGGKDIVANDGVLVVTDRASGGMTTTKLSRTPLCLLLQPHISLSGAVGIDALRATPDQIVLTVQDTAHPEQGSLTLTFAASPMTLTGVTATDIHGRTLGLTLTNLAAGATPPEGEFALPGE